MNTSFRQIVSTALIGCALVCGCEQAFGLGSDHPNGKPVRSNGHWPAGMEDLVNITNRVHGFFVNDEDVFFFSGSATNFSRFLQEFSKIQGTVDRHRLVLHEGVGEAKSPWEKIGQPCDWKLYGRGNGWKDGAITNYVLEVHFWTGGRIALHDVTIPKNVEIEKVK